MQLCVENAEYSHQDWEPVKIGTVDSRSLEFIVPEHKNVTIYVKFRNNQRLANNGWFLDNWLLQPIGPLAEGMAGQLSDIHGCRADMPAARQN